MKKRIGYFVLFLFLIVISFQLVSAAGKFSSGDIVETTIDMKVRPQAGFGTNLNDYFVVVAGSKGKVLEGPSSGEGYIWYKINFTDKIGWAVEDYLVKAGTTSNFDRITVLSPIAGQVSGNVNIDANFTPYTSCFGNCQFGFFSAILKNADSSTPYIGNRLVGQSFSTHLQIPNSQYSFDTNDFPNGEYILELIVYNPQGGVISNIKKIPLTINNPPIGISFKYPAANSVITSPSFLMDVEVTKNGQPYRPTSVGYNIKLANESDEEYLSLGATNPAFNGGDSRGYFGCHLVPVQLHQGKYIVRATLSQGQSATLPITINLASCPYNDTVDITSPTLTVISPRSGDDSFTEPINIKAKVHYPGDSFGLNPGPTQFSACFNSAGVYTGGGGPCTQFLVCISDGNTGGCIMGLSPDAFGSVDYNLKPSEGVQLGSADGGYKTVYPKPPYLVSVGASDEKGRGDLKYIYMSSNQSTPINITIPTNPPTNQTPPTTPTNVTPPTNQTPNPLCKLTLASWNKNAAGEGETITLNVFGENCDGKTVAFKIWEKDAVGDSDPVRYNPSNALFIRGTASTTALVEWQTDGLFGAAGNPEYYFTASVIGTNEKIDSGLLSVTETPSYVCGDGTCNGIETIDSCDVDCSRPTRRIPPTNPVPNNRTNQTNTTNQTTPSPACIDSDGGINYEVKGTLTYYLDNVQDYYTDICFNSVPGSAGISGPILREYHCAENNAPDQYRYFDYNCPNSCVDGACVQTILLPGTLAVGSWIQLTGNTHVRENPSDSSIVLTTQLSGARGQIIEGPVSADGLTWWNVDYETDKDGWSRSTLMMKIAKPELT